MVAALAVALSGLLPSAHVHADRDQQIVHRHVIGDGAPEHDDRSGDHDASVSHDDHAAARILSLSYEFTGQFAFVRLATVAAALIAVANSSHGILSARTTLLPTHDPPLRFVCSPAPPASA